MQTMNTKFSVQGTSMEELYIHGKTILKRILQKCMVKIKTGLTSILCCVNYEILIAKLEYYGVRGCILKWFKSYLLDRKQRVYIKTNDGQDYFSSWERVKQGVPQGSVLGLLFIIYINDLSPYINKLAKVFLFADDTSILVTGTNHAELKHKIMGTLPLIVDWFTANKLALDISKTNIIRFALKQSQNSLAVTSGNLLINEIPVIKFLSLQLIRIWIGNNPWTHKELAQNKVCLKQLTFISSRVERLVIFILRDLNISK
jgi:hypothetical protein